MNQPVKERYSHADIYGRRGRREGEEEDTVAGIEERRDYSCTIYEMKRVIR